MKRTPMPPRAKPLPRTSPTQGRTKGLRRTAIRPMSAKRRAENVVRRAVKERLVEERGGSCQLRGPDCDGLAVDAHEVVRRSQGGSITDADNILLVCRPCHERIDTHPEWAVDVGGALTREQRRERGL